MEQHIEHCRLDKSSGIFKTHHWTEGLGCWQNLDLRQNLSSPGSVNASRYRRCQPLDGFPTQGIYILKKNKLRPREVKSLTKV